MRCLCSYGVSVSSFNSVTEQEKEWQFQILNNLRKLEQILGLHLFLGLKAYNKGYLKIAQMEVKFN